MRVDGTRTHNHVQAYAYMHDRDYTFAHVGMSVNAIHCIGNQGVFVFAVKLQPFHLSMTLCFLSLNLVIVYLALKEDILHTYNTCLLPLSCNQY